MPRYNNRALLSGVFLVLTLGGCHSGSPASAESQLSKMPASPPPAPSTIAAATTAEQAATTATAPQTAAGSPSKISPELAAMAKQVRAAPDVSAASALSNRRIHVNAQGQIQVFVYVDHVDAAMKNRLIRAGARVELGEESMKVYQAWASPAALARISRLPGVVRITPPAYGFPK